MALTPTKMTASASRRQQACNNNQVPSTTTNDTASITGTGLSHPSAADANKYSNKNDYRKNDEYSNNLLHGSPNNYCHQNNNNNAFTIPHGDDNLPTSPSPPLANSQTTARAKNDKGGNNWKEEGGDENNNNGVGVPPTPTKRNDKSITPRSALSPPKLPGVAKSDGSNNNISTLGGERRRRERKASAFKDDSDSEGGKRRVAKRKKMGIGKNAFTSERSRDRNKQSNVSITEGNATTTCSRPRRSAAGYTNDYSEQLKGSDSEDDDLRSDSKDNADGDASIDSTKFGDADDEYLDDKKPPAARKSKMGKVLKGDRKKPAANISPTAKSTGMCVNLYPVMPSKMNTISYIILLSSNNMYSIEGGRW